MTNSSPPNRAISAWGGAFARKRSCRLPQQLVPGLVTKRVVDVLEVVDIDIKHGGRFETFSTIRTANTGERRC
jgi:hypothetical protein